MMTKMSMKDFLTAIVSTTEYNFKSSSIAINEQNL